MKKLLLSLSMLATGATFGQTPVAYYPFNGNANDESGNGHNGTVAGATITGDRFGNANSAYEFHGGNSVDSINCGHISELVGADNYTISCWLNQNQIDVAGGIWNFSNPNGSGMIQSRTWTDGNLYAYQNSFYEYDYSQEVTSGAWFHFAYVFENGATNPTRLYINGTEVTGSASGGAALPITQNNNANFCIGSDNHGYFDNNSWDGKIDDFYVYDAALSNTQIDSLYKLPNPNAGLVAHYPFNGNANDESGSTNIHNGTVTGATLVNDRFGNTNSAYSFNGTSNFIQVAHHADFSLDEQAAISTSFWINQSDVSTDGNLNSVINKYESIGNSKEYGFWTIDDGNAGAWRSFNEGGYFDTYSYSANQWYHVVVIFNRLDKTMKAYINGVLIFEDIQASGIYTATTTDVDLFFGAEGGSSRFYEGEIDDIFIYNYELSQAEIDSLYNLPDPASVSVHENGTVLANIYPNPTNNILNIQTGYKVKKVIIYNLIGEQVFLSSNETQLNIDTLPAGTFLVKVVTDDGESVQKLVKK